MSELIKLFLSVIGSACQVRLVILVVSFLVVNFTYLFVAEIAMLLPGSLGHTRTANNTKDIRKNLRMRDPKEYPQYDPAKT